MNDFVLTVGNDTLFRKSAGSVHFYPMAALLYALLVGILAAMVIGIVREAWRGRHG